MFCQKCKTPLKLDSSLNNLGPGALNLLTDASSAATSFANAEQSSRPLYSSDQKKVYLEASRNSHASTLHRAVSAPESAAGEGRHQPSNDGSMSFVMLTESQVVAPQTTATHKSSMDRSPRQKSANYQYASDEENLLSHKMETTARLFEILSSRSDIDHPICVECTDLLIEGMEKRLAHATHERDAYVNFLKDANADTPTDEERLQVKQELESIRNQEKTALSELEALEQEKVALEKELASLDEESRKLDTEEEAFWRERNAFSLRLAEFQSERDSVNLRYDHDTRQLDRLSRTNVYNDAFCIGHDGYFGTINGLRLGRTSGSTVDWPEINAALGQSCLLLAIIVEKLNIGLQGYKLNPIGSTSTVTKYEQSPKASATDATTPKANTSTLALYYSNDLPLSMGFLHRNFDNAMVAFLECVRQVAKHVERTTEGAITLPYELRKDKIRDNKGHEWSIKFGSFGGDENWTRACKCLLTCLKFLLAHASHVKR